jgi:ribosomal protein S14
VAVPAAVKAGRRRFGYLNARPVRDGSRRALLRRASHTLCRIPVRPFDYMDDEDSATGPPLAREARIDA